jgi:HAE1 family hydrophobic/amphiphilic exporter-1
MASQSSAEAATGRIQISSWSIRNPIPTIIFFLGMLVVGTLGFNAMRVNNWPDIDLPYVVVTVIRSGAAPQELQNQVTRIVEDSVSGLGGVRHINSTVNEGASTTVVEFTLDTDLEKATNDVRNAVAGVRGNLPSDVQDPIISRVDNAAGGALYHPRLQHDAGTVVLVRRQRRFQARPVGQGCVTTEPRRRGRSRNPRRARSGQAGGAGGDGV